MEKTKQILSQLNSFYPVWAQQFENPPELTVSFAVDEQGLLLLNDNLVCYAADIVPDSLFYDAEYFGFSLASGEEVIIEIEWHYSGAPRLIRCLDKK